MNQELKQQAYQVLINKIDVKVFEKSLYQLVEETELRSNSLLFNLVCINYKSKKYKKELNNIIKDYCTEEELLSLKIYENSLKAVQSTHWKEIHEIIEYFSNQYFGNEYEYDIFYVFYRLCDELDLLKSGYNTMTEDLIIKKAKEYSELVIDKFNFYKKNEDWIRFLTDTSYDDFNYSKNQEKKTNLDVFLINKEKNNKFMNFIKMILGTKEQ